MYVQWSQVCLVCNFVIDRKLEQRAKMKRCAKLGKSATDILSMLQQAYCEHIAMKQWVICKVLSDIAPSKAEDCLFEDNEWSGRPAMSVIHGNVKQIPQFVHENHRSTINDIAGLLYGSKQAILMSKYWIYSISLPDLSPACWPMNSKNIIYKFV